MEDSSRGEEMAAIAASRARDLPDPIPIPISAVPASRGPEMVFAAWQITHVSAQKKISDVGLRPGMGN
jgi:hypothetical protein